MNLTPDEYVVTAAPGAVSVDRTLLALLPSPSISSTDISAHLDPAGRVYPITFHPGQRRASDATWVALGAGDDRVGIDISMTPTASVSVTGTLVAPPDVLSQPFHVYLVAAGDLQEASMIGAIDATSLTADGRFRFSNIPAGTYTLMARPRSVAPESRLRLATQPVSVGSTDVTDLSVPLVRGRTVTGHLNFVGTTPGPTATQLASFGVTLSPVDLNPTIMARAGATGRVTLVGESDVTTLQIAVTNPDTATIVATFAFETYDDPSQTHVVAFPADRTQWREPYRWTANLADWSASDTGTVEMEVPPGDYVVATMAATGLTFWTSVSSLERLAAAGVRVSVKPGETKTVSLPLR